MKYLIETLVRDALAALPADLRPADTAQTALNVERTRDMFGQYAAQDVQKRLGKKDDWGTKKFTLSNGVKCNIPNRKCVKDEGEGERSKKITKHLFQAPAPQPR